MVFYFSENFPKRYNGNISITHKNKKQKRVKWTQNYYRTLRDTGDDDVFLSHLLIFLQLFISMYGYTSRTA